MLEGKIVDILMAFIQSVSDSVKDLFILLGVIKAA
jgi:hypothetical protein